MLYNACLIFLIFFSYSVLGWITECISCSLDRRKFIYDRGFLIGPYCPIYGMGGVAVYLILSNYQNDPVVLFVLGAVGASILEYITSYLMEKLFHARWWDYSNKRFNLEGRVCLQNAVLFGILGMIFTYLVNPYLTKFLKSISENNLIIIGIIAFIIFLIDIIVTLNIMTKLKLKVSTIKKDSTSEIDKQVREFLASYKFFIKRIFTAFPKLSISIPSGEKIQNRLEDIINTIEYNSAKKQRKILRLKHKLENTNNRKEKIHLETKIKKLETKKPIKYTKKKK